MTRKNCFIFKYQQQKIKNKQEMGTWSCQSQVAMVIVYVCHLNLSLKYAVLLITCVHGSIETWKLTIIIQFKSNISHHWKPLGWTIWPIESLMNTLRSKHLTNFLSVMFYCSKNSVDDNGCYCECARDIVDLVFLEELSSRNSGNHSHCESQLWVSVY